MNSGMRHRSACRRRTTSRCCYCYCLLLLLLRFVLDRLGPTEHCRSMCSMLCITVILTLLSVCPCVFRQKRQNGRAYATLDIPDITAKCVWQLELYLVSWFLNKNAKKYINLLLGTAAGRPAMGLPCSKNSKCLLLAGIRRMSGLILY